MFYKKKKDTVIPVSFGNYHKTINRLVLQHRPHFTVETISKMERKVFRFPLHWIRTCMQMEIFIFFNDATRRCFSGRFLWISFWYRKRTRIIPQYIFSALDILETTCAIVLNWLQTRGRQLANVFIIHFHLAHKRRKLEREREIMFWNFIHHAEYHLEMLVEIIKPTALPNNVTLLS